MCVLRYMTVSEMLETVHENDLVDMFPEFPDVVHILGQNIARTPMVKTFLSSPTFLQNKR